MERPLGRDPGKLARLLTLPREQWEAIEADLLDKGFTLADVPSRLSYRAVIAMVRYTSRESALGQVVGGDEMAWSTSDHLLASLVDLTRWLVWAKSDDARRKRNKPEPLPRPGVVNEKVVYGTASMTIEEADAWLADIHDNPRPLTPSEVLE